jgi:hypothetical protein
MFFASTRTLDTVFLTSSRPFCLDHTNGHTQGACWVMGSSKFWRVACPRLCPQLLSFLSASASFQVQMQFGSFGDGSDNY